jgi:hypothetical protein
VILPLQALRCQIKVASSCGPPNSFDTPLACGMLWAQDFNSGAFVPIYMSVRLPARQPQLTGGCKKRQPSPNTRRLTVPRTSTVPNSDQAKARADASFRKQERAREGAQAWTEHQAAARATLEKTARLRALRLTKEAAEKPATAAKMAARVS